MKENKYAIRLIEEWRLHGKIIVAVDYDDTICHWRLNTQQECDKVIKLLQLCQQVGIYTVVFTACNEDRHLEIRSFCEEKNLKIDSINQTPINLPFGNTNKIYANIFLDDRAGLEESMNILEFAAYTIRSEQHPVTIQTVEF